MLNETKTSENMSSTTAMQVQSSTPNVEIVRQQRFEVGPRYTDLKFVGEGAYGMYIN
jgi:mitogen-activated protein kinase 1/3